MFYILYVGFIMLFCFSLHFYLSAFAFRLFSLAQYVCYFLSCLASSCVCSPFCSVVVGGRAANAYFINETLLRISLTYSTLCECVCVCRTLARLYVFAAISRLMTLIYAHTMHVAFVYKHVVSLCILVSPFLYRCWCVCNQWAVVFIAVFFSLQPNVGLSLCVY